MQTHTASRILAFALVLIVCHDAVAAPRRVATADLGLRMFYPGLTQLTAIDSAQFTPVPTADTNQVHSPRLALVGGALLSSMVAIHFYQQNGWWKDNRSSFHFQEDLVYGLGVDKIGHFYAAHVMGFMISKSLEWANYDEERALWIGSAGSLLFQTYVEIEDGFSTWGFDRIDFVTDLAGAAWPIARHYAPALQHLDLKVSYHSSPLIGSPGGAGFRGQQHLVFDDYEGQTFWLSVKVHGMLPQQLQQVWPEFLCLALGYGARNVADVAPYPVYFLALDLDVTKVLPQKSGFLRILSEALNFIHLPMPAVQVSPHAIWYGLYF